MELFLAIATGAVFAFALQTLLRRSFLRMVIGFMLISNAVNLIIFTVGRLTRGLAPIVPSHEKVLEHSANPLPQALILTAIVISFGITAFTFTLAFRVHRTLGSLDTDRLALAESDEKASAPTEEDHLAA